MATGDWDFGRGLQSYAENADAVALNVRTRLRSWRGDCFFAMLDGIDWQNRLARFGQESGLRAEVSKTILDTDGVLSIDGLEISSDGRHARANYTLNTVYSKSMADAVEVGNA
jgi:hypothetical protein